jgi:hypothetical protein
LCAISASWVSKCMCKSYRNSKKFIINTVNSQLANKTLLTWGSKIYLTTYCISAIYSIFIHAHTSIHKIYTGVGACVCMCRCFYI